jgi:N4-gp56 family major capsid protein
MAVNLAAKYSNKVDEKFERQSQASLVTNNSYDFDGVDTVKVYSIDTVPLGNYTRSGANRYGTPSELGDTIQTMKVTQDKSWTFTIDKGNFKQSEMVRNAGRACARQIAQVVIPEYDKYVFTTLGKAAYSITDGTGTGATHPHADTTAATKSNAYELFLKGQEVLGNENVPDAGRVALCSYKFANLLKQDSAFMRYANLSQEMIIKGILGEVDGVKVVKVPASRLPAGANFILTHPMACVAPKQLWEYKIHTDAPGISGWLCEGRVLYDAFVLEQKKVAVYYCGADTDVK